MPATPRPARRAVGAPGTDLAAVGEFGPFDEVSDVAHGLYVDGFAERAVEACRQWVTLTDAAGDVQTSRYLRYIECIALHELSRDDEALAAADALLHSLGDALEPVWRAKSLAITAEAATLLGSHTRAMVALADADWLLGAIEPGTYGHLSASMAVALALRSVNLIEQADDVFNAIDAHPSPGVELLVAQERALLQAYWAASLRLIDRHADARGHALVLCQRALRMGRLAEASDNPLMVARATALEAYGLLLLGEVDLARSRASAVDAAWTFRRELVESHLLQIVLGRCATEAGDTATARAHLEAAVADADRLGREVWAATGRAALAVVAELEHGPHPGLDLWRRVAVSAMDRSWLEREARFSALHDRRALRRAVDEGHRAGAAALEDPLTGLGNRRALMQALERPDRARWAVFVDVDNFKDVNDLHSHAVGDEVLRTLGAVLRGVTRGNDLVTRFGGDEFVVLPDGDQEAAVELAARVHAAVRAYPWERLLSGDGLTVSVGVGPTRPGATSEAILSADSALLTAKRQGRDQVVVVTG